MGTTRAAHRSREEMLQLVTGCRQSGLSDAEWCRQHGICPSTFYGWVGILRRDACEIPAPSYGKITTESPKRDIVRVEMLPDSPEPAAPFRQSDAAGANIDNSHTIEIETSGIMIRATNAADPSLLVRIIYTLKEGLTC